MNKKTILMTNEPPRFLEVGRDPARPGPMMGQGTSPVQYIVQNASSEELTAFRQIIEARIAKEPKEVWEICDKCGDVFSHSYRGRRGGACLRCNFTQIEGGGMMREMTPKEIRAHLERDAKKEAEWLERTRAAAYNHDCEDRKKHGLEPLTRAQFDARAKREWEKKRAENREMMNLARKLAKDLPR